MKLVLLDRDGVINESPGPGYVTSPSQLILIKGSAQAIARLNKADIKVAVITNQSIVGQGGLLTEELTAIHDHLSLLLEKEKAFIDKFYICTDPPWAPTHRRKPNPGMLAEALYDFNVLPAHTPFIGDSLSDLEAAYAQGCLPYLVRTGHGSHVEYQGIPSHLSGTPIHDNLDQSVTHYLETFS